jgi:hypothetical protein
MIEESLSLRDAFLPKIEGEHVHEAGMECMDRMPFCVESGLVRLSTFKSTDGFKKPTLF